MVRGTLVLRGLRQFGRRWKLRRHRERYRRMLEQPQVAQMAILRRILSENASSGYGREQDFGSIQSYDDWSTRVPLLDRERLAVWAARIRGGDERALTDEAESGLLDLPRAGGEPRSIPWSGSFLSELKNGIAPWLGDLIQRHPGVDSGGAYWALDPVSDFGFEERGGLLPRFGQEVVPGNATIRNAGIDAYRRELRWWLLRSGNLNFLSIGHPAFLRFVLGDLALKWDALVGSIAEGVTPGGRSTPGMPARARELRESGPDRLDRIWPGLELISCWGYGPASRGLQWIRKAFPSSTVQAKGLSVAEGLISVPFEGEYPLAITSHFLEFRDRDGEVRPGWNLERDKTYQVIITNGAGLYRCPLEEWVRVTGRLYETPTIYYLGNSDPWNEDVLRESDVHEAVKSVMDRFNLPDPFAILTYEEGAPGHYRLFVESAVKLATNFAAALEFELLKIPAYRAGSEAETIGRVGIFRIEHSGLESWMEYQLKRGRPPERMCPSHLTSEQGLEKIFSGEPVSTEQLGF